MVDNFKKAMKILRTSNTKMHIIAVNGCCYGNEKKPDKGEYLKLCGQTFWSFISNNDTLYTDIIEPIGYDAKKKNEEFTEHYAAILNKFTFEFGDKFCAGNGNIEWQKLVQFNSARALQL